MGDNRKSVFEELWSSFKFYRESKKGKYSLNTYLDIIGEYTDRLILKGEEEALRFLGGICEVQNNNADGTFDFMVKMYFENSNGENISKEAHRCLSKKQFTSETENEIGERKTFEIHKPK